MRRPPWRLRCFDTLPSTQDVARAAAEAGEPGRLSIRAERQTHGRGTKGRGWQDALGNLALSIMLRPDGEAGPWSLLAAVCVAEALASHLPPAMRPSLKWPNDVLLGGSKVAGLLTEAASDADGRCAWVVIGCGVNLAAAPPVPGRQVSALAAYAKPPSPAAFATELLDRLDHWDGVRARDGFAPVRAAWLCWGPAEGTRLALRASDGARHSGGFAGLAPDGSLRLKVDGVVRAFASAELEDVAPCSS